MRILFIILLLFSNVCFATIYYVSTAGNDGAAGTSTGTSWKTITKVNSSSFNPGDQILFNRGDIFFGALTIPSSGTAGQRISFGAYGSGAKPVISGFVTAGSWVSIGSGRYESVIGSAGSTLNMVTRDGSFQAIGRWPKLAAANSGYLTFQSHSGTSSVTSNAISGALSYVGGEVVLRSSHYYLNRGTISNQTSTTVTYSPLSTPYPTYDPQDNSGLFFQNHPNACTALGDWSYTASSQKLTMYFGGASPASYVIKASVIDDLVTVSSKNYITFDNIKFEGSNQNAFRLISATNVIIQNCDINFHGQDGITPSGSCNNNTVTSCTISYVNNNGMNATSSPGWTVSNNDIHDIAYIAGMGVGGDGQYNGLFGFGSGSLIEYNTVRKIGYVGIFFDGSNVTVRYNLVDSFCMVKSDGGGIYSGNAGSSRVIQNNIVINGIGAGDGTTDGQYSANGIYVDDNGSGYTITNNSVASCALSGLFLHNAHDITVTGNTIYNCETHYAPLGGGILINYDGGGTAVSNITMNNNIFFALTSAERTANYAILGNPSGWSGWGAINNNYYARPIGPNTSIHTFSNSYSVENDYTIPQWNSASGRDGSSSEAPWTIASTSEMRFEYNATNASVVVALGANYVDIYNTSYAGTITLAPYTSAILKYVSALSGIPTDPPNPTSNSPQTTTVTLTRSGSPPAGVTWYWQFSCGTSTVVGASATYNATTSGTYYIRARDNTSGVWSTGCGSLAVVVTGGSVPSNPGNPTSNSPQAGSVTITRVGSPGGGETWYWQNTSCGTSTAFGSGTTFNATSTGTYYIRANNAYGWSAACGSVAVTVVAPGTTNTIFKYRILKVSY